MLLSCRDAAFRACSAAMTFTEVMSVNLIYLAVGTRKHMQEEEPTEAKNNKEQTQTETNADETGAMGEGSGQQQQQRTVTIGRSAYATLVSAYEKNKVKLLERENIRTVTEYARARLLRGVEEDVLEGRFEIVGKSDNTISVMDYYEQVEVEVAIQSSEGGGEGTMEVYCRHDESGECDHVGFVLADVDVIKRARELGVVLRKAAPPKDVQEALRVFEILSDASEEGLVEEDSFVRALVRSKEFTKQQAREMLERLHESGEIHMARAHRFRRTGRSAGSGKIGMPAER